ncbi:hypothetical protein QBC39DRAFT_32962 [Podospora conica]|nr:hypothetical protein QBC39DRAFT_32962 [Schizothecium conicum]
MGRRQFEFEFRKTRVTFCLSFAAPADCGMRVNGMRRPGSRAGFPPPWTGGGPRWLRQRRRPTISQAYPHQGRDAADVSSPTWCRGATDCRFVDSQERAARGLRRWAGLSSSCRTTFMPARLSCVTADVPSGGETGEEGTFGCFSEVASRGRHSAFGHPSVVRNAPHYARALFARSIPHISFHHDAYGCLEGRGLAVGATPMTDLSGLACHRIFLGHR